MTSLKIKFMIVVLEYILGTVDVVKIRNLLDMLQEKDLEEKEVVEEDFSQEIAEIHAHWLNLLSDINKAKLTENLKKRISTKLKKWDKEKIIKGISNYNEIYRSEYYYSHHFSLMQFIKQGNGLPRFIEGLDENYNGDIWNDYLKNYGRRAAADQIDYDTADLEEFVEKY